MDPEKSTASLGLFVAACRLSIGFRAFNACESLNAILALCQE